jgi:5,10-methylenetetrahydrofolate reductase
MYERRVKVGGQFFTTGPVMDPSAVAPCAERLGLKEGDPPVYLELTPPFSASWVKRLEAVGAIALSDGLRARLASTPEGERRRFGWRVAQAIAAEARIAGFAGIVIMGLRYETVVGEAYEVWHDDEIPPIEIADVQAWAGIPG